MRKSTSVQFKTIILSIIVPEIFLLIFTVILGTINYRSEYENTKDLLYADSRGISDSIYIEMSESFEMLRNLSVNPVTLQVIKEMNTVPNGLDNDDYIGLDRAAELSNLMDSISTGTRADLLFVGAKDSSGLLLSRDVQLTEGFDVRGRDYYQSAFEMSDITVISEPRVSAEDTVEPKIVITAARAVVEDGEVQGIVALNYTFDPIIAIFRDLKEKYSVDIAFYDWYGEYLLWTENESYTYFYNPEDIVSFDDLSISMGTGEYTEEYRQMLSEQTDFFFEGNVTDEINMVQAITIPNTRWSLFVSNPVREIRRNVLFDIMPPLLISLVVFMVLQSFVFMMYSRIIIKPLVGIGDKLKKLADADADLTMHVPVHRDDEIGAVALSFNTFVEKLRELMQEVKEIIVDTDNVKMNVIASAEETSTAIEQISANLDAIGKQIDVLDSNISSTVTAIEEVTQNISSVDEQIITQSSMVEESTAAVTEMIASLNNVNSVAQNKQQTTKALSNVASDGKQKITETAQAFKMVSSQIREIQDMATTINGIAAQTNLLSMNAAIEAAHAGDSGKGFAVVAEEIRKLADSAGTSAKTITQTIKGIIHSVDETDKNVIATTNAFEQISSEVTDTVNAFSEIEESVKELSIGGQQILDSTNQINDVTISIRSGSAEIKAGTNSMLENSTQIKEVSDRVTTGMAESITGTQEIVRSMQNMMDLNQKLGDIVDQLKHSFGQFKTE